MNLFAKIAFFSVARNLPVLLNFNDLVTFWGKCNQNQCRQVFPSGFCPNCSQTADIGKFFEK